MTPLKGWFCIALATLGTLILIAQVLPWAARNGYAGSVIRENYEQDRDASALFYSESDRVWEILRNTDGHQRGS